MKKYKIAQVGAFDMENYGDLLFENLFVSEITKRLDIEKVFLFAPKETTKAFEPHKKVYSVVDLEEVYLKEKFDAIIVGGGDLVHFEKIYTIMPALQAEPIIYESFFMWIIPILIGTKYNIPVIFNAPGVPKIFFEEEYNFVRHLLDNVDYISVRDPLSKENLVKTGLLKKDIVVCPDTVLYIHNVIDKKFLEKKLENLSLEIKNTDDYLVFHINSSYTEKDIESYAKILCEVEKKNKVKIVLLPIGYALGDMKAITDLKQFLTNAVIVSKKITPVETLSIIANAKAYIGSSLHGAITANSYGVPALAYNYNHFNKIDGYFQLTNQSSNVVYKMEDLSEKVDEVLKSHSFDPTIYDSEIEQHFDTIAKIIAESDANNKDAKNIAVDICEDHYKLRQLIEEVQRITQKKYEVISTLYIDYGNGYSSENKVSKVITVENDSFHVTFKIPERDRDQIKSLRWDPCEAFCEITDIKISQALDCVPYNGIEKNKWIQFFTSDPIFLLKGNFNAHQLISISGKIKRLKQEKVFEHYEKEFQKNMVKIKKLEEKVNTLNHEKEEILNSTIWKASKPIRTILDKTKKLEKKK